MRPHGSFGMGTTRLSLAAFYGHPEGSCGLLVTGLIRLGRKWRGDQRQGIIEDPHE